jgi:CheY-like chemotaxis protein
MVNKRKILIVDDNAGNRLLLQYNLEGYFDVDFACNGCSAVDKFSTNNYDLILMDVHMPEMDGIEATLKIRALEEGKTRTPIFGITSNMFKDQKNTCIEAGMDDYIMKPIHAKALVEHIRNYLNSALYSY